MDHFEYRNGELYAEDIKLSDLAQRWGTPSYVYSRATLRRHWLAFDNALAAIPHRVCYAVKANSNLAVLQVLAQLGSGFDIVSTGELERVLMAGGDPASTVYSGVGKTALELKRALELGIGCINVESASELELISDLAAQLRVRAPIALRVNPDVDAQTHPYISTGLKENKFGIDLQRAEQLYLLAAQRPSLQIIGIASHIGSQLLSIEPYLDALQRVLALVDRLQQHGIRLQHIDVGGGLGIRYREEQPIAPADWASAIATALNGRELQLLTEPGRAIAGNAGILLSRVILEKPTEVKTFLVVDAAMNDLIRPTLYNAWMEVVPVVQRQGGERQVDIVGPICESGDWLAKDRSLNLEPGDLLAIRGAGAYGFVMSSNYNSRPRAAEIMVDGDQAWCVRQRETLSDLVRGESLLPQPNLS